MWWLTLLARPVPCRQELLLMWLGALLLLRLRLQEGRRLGLNEWLLSLLLLLLCATEHRRARGAPVLCL